jgi:hypothetical protein
MDSQVFVWLIVLAAAVWVFSEESIKGILLRAVGLVVGVVLTFLPVMVMG